MQIDILTLGEPTFKHTTTRQVSQLNLHSLLAFHCAKYKIACRKQYMTQLTHRLMKHTRICTHNCRKKMHHTQPTHKCTPNKLSIVTCRHIIDIHPSSFTSSQITPQPIGMQSIFWKIIRTLANVHDPHRINKTIKLHNVLAALKTSKNRYSNPSLSTNLGPNAEGKTVMSLSPSNLPAQAASRWPHEKIRKKLSCNLLQTKPSQSIHRLCCLLVTCKPKAQLSSENKQEYFQKTNKYETNVH
jgi:hypothetical protein